MPKTGFRVVGFQEPATPVMEGIVDLHHYITFYLALILGFVLWILYDVLIQHFEIFSIFRKLPYFQSFSIFNSYVSLRRIFLQLNKINHATNLEIIWTTLPSVILVFIAVPSLALLYSMDELLHPQLTFKATGYQWYWTYEFSDTSIHDNFLLGFLEYTDYSDLTSSVINKFQTDYYGSEEFHHLFFESYMLADDDLHDFVHHRLLSTDHPIVLPIETHIRLLVTGSDVLHSWAVPSLGIKIDAVPGRLNQVGIYLKRQGVFYGQCSELCGANHAFMPIVVKSVSLLDFLTWVRSSMYNKWALTMK